MTDKELLDSIYMKLESYATNLNDTYNDLVQNDLDEELEWSANEIMNEKIVVYDLMYKIPKLEEKIELLTKYKRAFEILKEKLNFELVHDDEYCEDEIWYLDSKSGTEITKEEYELLEELMSDGKI